MEAGRFDSLSRSLIAARSRRGTLGGLAAGVLLALGPARDETPSLAKNNGKGNGHGKKNKKKHRKKKRFGCDGIASFFHCGDTCCSSSEICCGNTVCCLGSETCRNGTCLHHCEDGETNFGETDKDCGGSCRELPGKKCEVDGRCLVDADCVSNVCRDVAGVNRCLMCRSDSDCARFTFPHCVNNLCVECRGDSECPPGQTCDFDFCTNGCADNLDCPSGVACVDEACTGSCEPQGPCPTCANNPDVSCCGDLCNGETCCDFGCTAEDTCAAGSR